MVVIELLVVIVIDVADRRTIDNYHVFFIDFSVEVV